MDTDQIILALEDISQLKGLGIDELEALVKEYPYFQTAHILLAKKYQLENHPDYEKQLKASAAYASNRTLLYDFMNVPDSTGDIEVETESPLKETKLSEIETVKTPSPGTAPETVKKPEVKKKTKKVAKSSESAEADKAESIRAAKTAYQPPRRPAKPKARQK